MRSNVVRIKEVAERMDCSESKASSIIRKLNDELKAKGYITIAGRVPRQYFEERCLLLGVEDGHSRDQGKV